MLERQVAGQRELLERRVGAGDEPQGGELRVSVPPASIRQVGVMSMVSDPTHQGRSANMPLEYFAGVRCREIAVRHDAVRHARPRRMRMQPASLLDGVAGPEGRLDMDDSPNALEPGLTYEIVRPVATGTDRRVVAEIVVHGDVP